MSLFNKILGKPSGRGVGQAIGGTGEFYPLTANLAFLRDDFNGSTPDVDEWTFSQTGTGSYYCSDGRLVVDLGTSSTGTIAWSMVSKDSFRVPFRFEAGVSVDGIGTAMDYAIRVRDSGNTWVAEWLFVGSAGGTEHTASMRLRAGSTAAGMSVSAAFDPSAAITIAGSAALTYVIDVDYAGVTWAFQSASVGSTAVLTAIPAVPSVKQHVKSPVLKANQVYYVEFVARAGSAVDAAGAGNSATNASAYLRIDYAQVLQYAPDANFQSRQNVLQVYSATTGSGVTALTGLTQLKWG